MTTVGQLFPSRFLKAEDDFEEGETKTLTIDRWEQEELGRGQNKETKPVLYFKEINKGLVLNKTNAAIIAETLNLGTLEEWVGKQITLFTMEVDSFGDIVRAIRVKAKAKGKPTATPKAGTNGGSAKPPFKQPAPVRVVMQDADRPMAPADVKAWINAKHDTYLDKPVPPGDTVEKMRGLAAGTLGKWFDDDRRHWLLDALFGVKSSKALNYMQIAALLSYLALERGDDGKYHETANSDYAKAELTLMLEQYQIEQGQGTMELAA